MVQTTADASVDFVLEQIETMGGTIGSPVLEGDSLKVQYTPGVNEGCPECVPTLDMVRQFLTASIGIHAPHITDIEVS